MVAPRNVDSVRVDSDKRPQRPMKVNGPRIGVSWQGGRRYSPQPLSELARSRAQLPKGMLLEIGRTVGWEHGRS
jgi:hypothetical protein